MKKTLLIVACMAICTLASAQAVETTTYDDGRVYIGQRDGKGKINGKGLMTWPNGDRYDGEWKKGIMEGEGTYTYANAGYSYTGQWKKGFIKGHGTFRFSNGNVMEGDWESMGTGTGYLLFADGTRYDGPFLNGAPQGQGIKVWANGDRYEGTFVQGHLAGQGTISISLLNLQVKPAGVSLPQRQTPLEDGKGPRAHNRLQSAPRHPPGRCPSDRSRTAGLPKSWK